MSITFGCLRLLIGGILAKRIWDPLALLALWYGFCKRYLHLNLKQFNYINNHIKEKRKVNNKLHKENYRTLHSASFKEISFECTDKSTSCNGSRLNDSMHLRAASRTVYLINAKSFLLDERRFRARTTLSISPNFLKQSRTFSSSHE